MLSAVMSENRGCEERVRQTTLLNEQSFRCSEVLLSK
jgi:hypothetical protein